MLSMSMDLTDHAAVIVGRLDGAHTQRDLRFPFARGDAHSCG